MMGERRKRAGFWVRWRTMGRVAIKMVFYDKLKLVGTLLGVVFAVVLSNQQAGTFLGLLYSAPGEAWVRGKR